MSKRELLKISPVLPLYYSMQMNCAKILREIHAKMNCAKILREIHAKMNCAKILRRIHANLICLNYFFLITFLLSSQ